VRRAQVAGARRTSSIARCSSRRRSGCRSAASNRSSALRCAARSASSAATGTSGRTPTPSQSVPVTGLTARPEGTQTPNCSVTRRIPAGMGAAAGRVAHDLAPPLGLDVVGELLRAGEGLLPDEHVDRSRRVVVAGGHGTGAEPRPGGSAGASRTCSPAGWPGAGQAPPTRHATTPNGPRSPSWPSCLRGERPHGRCRL
jgi:hypothetical protein